MKNETFYVTFCTDNRAIQDIGVCLESLFSNNPYHFEIFILHSKPIEKEKIKLLAKKWNQKINFIKVDPTPIKKLPLQGFWVEETYYRLLIPRYLPRYVKQTLYLDTDTLVVKDICDLLKIKLENKSLAANPGDPPENYFAHEDFLGIKRGTYFGAAVVLINVKKIRKRKLFEKAIKWAEENPEKVRSVDQDILNKFFSEDYIKIGNEYSCWLVDGYKPYCDKKITKIVHFNGKWKGSSYLCLHPFRDQYLYYLRRTPWAGNFEQITLFRWFIRNALYFARRVKHSSLGNFLTRLITALGKNSKNVI